MANRQMPLCSFGTMEPPGKSASVMQDAVYHAIKVGYRHFDTAEIYKTTRFVGEAFKAAYSDGIVKPDELFITGKIRGMPLGPYSFIEERVKHMLTVLNIQRFSLLLIHWPGPDDINLETESPEEVEKRSSFMWFKERVPEAWRNMIKLQRDGYTEHIGTSNFYQEHLEEIFDSFPSQNDRPYANEIYLDVCHQESELVKFMRDNRIETIAYRSLVFLSICQMIDDVRDSLSRAQKLSEEVKSLHKVILTWLYTQNICVVTSSTNFAHIEENYRSLGNGDLDSQALSDLDGNEMVEMYGGLDEYAKAFKQAAGSKAAVVHQN